VIVSLPTSCLQEAGRFSGKTSETSLVGSRIGMTKYLFASRKLATAVTIQVGSVTAAWFLLTSGTGLVRSEVLG